MTHQQQLENVEYCIHLGSLTIIDIRCTCEIRSRISMATAAFNKKRILSAP
jgi:hypothetical protein